MRQVGVEVIGFGALKLTGFLKEKMQENNISFQSLYTVRTLKEVWPFTNMFSENNFVGFHPKFLFRKIHIWYRHTQAIKPDVFIAPCELQPVFYNCQYNPWRRWICATHAQALVHSTLYWKLLSIVLYIWCFSFCFANVETVLCGSWL